MKRDLGQNFLAAEEILEEAAQAIPLKGKTVLEIGAGHGELTVFLAKEAKSVVALELDHKLISSLRENLLAQEIKNVKIVCADALEFDFSGYEVIYGNLPYYITTPLLFKIIKSGCKSAVLLVQAEVGERIVAGPGGREYSRLSVMVQSQADAGILDFVPKECFNPIPKVDSVLLKLAMKKNFFLDEKLVNALFQHKNQSVKNALVHSTAFLGIDKQKARAIADSLDFGGDIVFCLSLKQLETLCKKFKGFSEKT
ncbi:ribosomal RNA small subunit methyltransferase A [Candidatus Micrarchaeota archaeon]|nr:ribosomal RNA small subunit methyltransferase A [Candidatus Micrarchaeota archaeon]